MSSFCTDPALPFPFFTPIRTWKLTICLDRKTSVFKKDPSCRQADEIQTF